MKVKEMKVEDSSSYACEANHLHNILLPETQGHHTPPLLTPFIYFPVLAIWKDEMHDIRTHKSDKPMLIIKSTVRVPAK